MAENMEALPEEVLIQRAPGAGLRCDGCVDAEI